MRRGEFIRTSAGASAAVVAIALGVPQFNPTGRLEAWARRYGATVPGGQNAGHLVIHPSHRDLAASLQELSKIADGPLHCSGRFVTGCFQHRPFRLELRTA